MSSKLCPAASRRMVSSAGAVFFSGTAEARAPSRYRSSAASNPLPVHFSFPLTNSGDAQQIGDRRRPPAANLLQRRVMQHHKRRDALFLSRSPPPLPQIFPQFRIRTGNTRPSRNLQPRFLPRITHRSRRRRHPLRRAPAHITSLTSLPLREPPQNARKSADAGSASTPQTPESSGTAPRPARAPPHP